MAGSERNRPVLECRECEVICERVVCPWQCLKDGRTCIYAFEEEGITYFGCLHKVFAPEFDLSAFNADGEGRGGKSDPYGAVRVARMPRAQCPVSIERAYRVECLEGCCVNPAFPREVFEVATHMEIEEVRGDRAADDLANG